MEHMNYRFSQINTTHIETGKAALWLECIKAFKT
jgi:hypothetical protein